MVTIGELTQVYEELDTEHNKLQQYHQNSRLSGWLAVHQDPQLPQRLAKQVIQAWHRVYDKEFAFLNEVVPYLRRDETYVEEEEAVMDELLKEDLFLKVMPPPGYRETVKDMWGTTLLLEYVDRGVYEGEQHRLVLSVQGNTHTITHDSYFDTQIQGHILASGRAIFRDNVQPHFTYFRGYMTGHPGYDDVHETIHNVLAPLEVPERFMKRYFSTLDTLPAP